MSIFPCVVPFSILCSILKFKRLSIKRSFNALARHVTVFACARACLRFRASIRRPIMFLSFIEKFPLESYWAQFERNCVQFLVNNFLSAESRSFFKRTPTQSAGNMDETDDLSGFAYFVSICTEKHSQEKPHERITYAQFSKTCREKWTVRTFTHCPNNA